MLRSSFFNDPFFAGQDEHMRQMDGMLNPALGHGGSRNRMALPEARHHQQQRAQNMQVAGRDMFMDPFAHFNSMFSNMHSMMTDMHRAFDGSSQPNGNGHVYQQSSFTSYSTNPGGNGAPRVYQASSSSRQGPDGVRETKKTVRDSETGVDKIAVGRHIQNRGYVVEQERNNKTGDMGKNQEYINLDEEDMPTFEKEYWARWHSTMRGVDQRRHAERSRHAPVAGSRRQAALPEPEPRRPRKSNH